MREIHKKVRGEVQHAMGLVNAPILSLRGVLHRFQICFPRPQSLHGIGWLEEPDRGARSGVYVIRFVIYRKEGEEEKGMMNR